MSDVNCAQAAVNFYAQRSPLLRGHVIHVQFSNHNQLLPDDASLQVRVVVSCHLSSLCSSASIYLEQNARNIDIRKDLSL